MARTKEELEAAAAAFEQWADEVDPDAMKVDDRADLRAVADASDAVDSWTARLVEAVAVARAHGRSWGEIGIALGVSRQAARQRFGQLVEQ